jgi:uncharacterized protein YciI
MPESSEAPRKPDVPRSLNPYFLCLLRKGPQWDITQGHEDLMLLHLAFFRQQIEAGKMVLAGPILDETDTLRGICILRAEDLDAAKAAANQDPAIKTGHLTAEVLPALLPSLDSVKVEY